MKVVSISVCSVRYITLNLLGDHYQEPFHPVFITHGQPHLAESGRVTFIFPCSNHNFESVESQTILLDWDM